jgi:tRNA-dihydrouridine synthase B
MEIRSRKKSKLKKILNKFMTPHIGLARPWLAPLAGHSDLAFRLLCREQGAAAACTEMVSARGLIYGENNGKGRNATKELLRTTEDDSPLVVQIFGDEPEFLGQAVALLRSWGFGWFDLNLGCAVPKVTKAGAGAALAKDPRRAAASAKAMLKAAGAPTCLPGPADNLAGVAAPKYAPAGRVGFKLRLGWSREEENYLELGRELEQCGAGWLVLHPRYARQGFSGCADYTALEKLVRAVKIPVMASGDLFSAESALRVAGQTGVSGLVFARGALHNPVIFKDYLLRLEKILENNADKTEDKNSRADAIFLKKLILRHAGLIHTVNAVPERDLFKMRGATLRYVRDLPGSRLFRQAVSTCESWAEFYKLVEDFFGGKHADN